MHPSRVSPSSHTGNTLYAAFDADPCQSKRSRTTENGKSRLEMLTDYCSAVKIVQETGEVLGIVIEIKRKEVTMIRNNHFILHLRAKLSLKG